MEDEEDEKPVIVLPPMKVRHLEMDVERFEQVKMYVHEAIQENKLEKDISMMIKKKLDSDPKFNLTKGAWHCVVGRGFACSVTHEAKWVAFFDVIPAKLSVLLFRSQ